MICPVCQHSTDEHHLYGCTEGADAELAALRANAAAFDWLAAMKGVEITQGGQTWAIWDTQGTTSRFIASGKTLAEAVRLAMEAEGER